MIMLCTDDRQADLLVESGHLDGIVRLAIKMGIDPITAIQMATINVADYLRIDRDFGSISPGRIADIAIVDDLESLEVSKVVFHGKLAAQDGVLINAPGKFKYPSWSKNTINVRKKFIPEDFHILATSRQPTAAVRVLIPGLPKGQKIETLEVRNAVVLPDQERDILSMAVIERHKGTGNIGKCFVGETGIKNGAIASTVSHDAHNIFVIGSSFESMAICVNRLIEQGGGFVLVKGEQVIDSIELAIAGLISDKPFENVSADFRRFEQTLSKEMHCKLQPLPLYWLSLISLPNIPELGITDKGLIDSVKMEIISPIIA